MITLIQYKSGLGVPNLSPFCCKLETWLRMAELPFEIQRQDDPRKATKGKLPMVIDSDGETLCDSSHIIERLTEKHKLSLDSSLSDAQHAEAIAWQRLLEDHFYWAMLYSRWVDEKTWPSVSNFWFGELPFPLKKIIPVVARREVKKNLHAHGLGRHTAEQVYAFGLEDLQAVSERLGEQAFFFGDTAHGIDAIIYAFAVNMVKAQLDAPMIYEAKQLTNLKPYCDRIEARYYPNDPRLATAV